MHLKKIDLNYYKPVEAYVPSRRDCHFFSTAMKLMGVAGAIIILSAGIGTFLIGTGTITPSFAGLCFLTFVVFPFASLAIHSVKKYVQFLKTKERYNQNAIFQHLTGEPEHSIAPLYLRVKARGYEDVILPRISFKEGASIFYQSSFDDEKCRKPKKEWENTFFAFYVPETDDYELLCWKQQHGKELKRVIANSVYVILTFNQKGDVDWSYETKNTGSEIPCLVSKYVKCTSAEMEVTRLLKAGYTPYHPIPDIKAQSVYPHAFSLITNSDAEWWEDLFLEISKKQSEVKSRSYDYKCETDFIIAEGDITESNVKVISGKAEDSKDKAKDSKSKPGKYYKFMRHLFRITPDEIPRTPKAFMQSIKRIKNIVVSQM